MMDEREPVAIELQIKAVERELEMRRSVYPRRVAEKKMSQEAADREIARMVAVKETLRAAPRVMTAVRATIGTLREEGGSVRPAVVAVDAEPLFDLQQAAPKGMLLDG